MINKGYEDKLYEAISYIAENVVNKADFDKTVQGTIVECVDSALGKYTVRYQDATFYAYSNNTNILYSKGTSVYILIPGNDTSRDKTILGSVKKLGTDYIRAIDDQQKYEIIGENLIDNTYNYPYSFSSYKTETNYFPMESTLIYDNMVRYLYNADYMKISADFWSDIPLEQQKGGNFGVKINLQFKDKETNQITTKTYTLDANSIEGNPYKINSGIGGGEDGLTRLSVYYKIDGKNLESINGIRTFVESFPIQDEEKAKNKDIIIGNVRIEAARLTNENDLETYSLSLTTPKGTYLDNSHSSIDIEAKVKIKGKELSDTAQNIKYYWFIENTYINSKSLKYNDYGGSGWECLNSYTRTNNSSSKVEWTPAKSVLTLTSSDVVSKKTKYKCIAVYENNKISNEIYIYNENSSYLISLESDSGTDFFYNIGKPSLTAKINGVEETGDNYSYYWGVEDNVGNFSFLEEDTHYNTRYNQIVEELAQLKEDIANEIKMPNAEAQNLAYLEKQKEYYGNITRVEKNKLYNIEISSILDFANYKVSVYNSNNYIGSASILLTNNMTDAEECNLVIDNSSQIFKYDSRGTSPAIASTYEIKPLVFRIFNSLGQEIDKSYISKENISWKIPLINTMIRTKNNINPYAQDEKYAYYHEYDFSFEIAEEYNYNYKNNLVELEINYEGKILNTSAGLSFIKEGENATNGTDFLCKIVPNVNGDYNEDAVPGMINGKPNFAFKKVGEWFRVEIWKNGKKVFSSYENGFIEDTNIPVTLNWGMLRNKYNVGTRDRGTVFYNESTGFYSNKAEGESYNSEEIDIVECKIKIDDKTQYITLPLVQVFLPSNNTTGEIYLERNSGYQYVFYDSDGTNPHYDKTKPFRIIVKNLINGYKENISNTSINYNTTYFWEAIGRKYVVDKGFINDKNLFEDDINNVNVEKNEKFFYPSDKYMTETLCNKIYCRVFVNGEFFGNISIPVHFLLNREGLNELEGWNGNSIQVGEQGGSILVPQIGSGKIEKGPLGEDNSFTGIFVGKVKEAGQKEYYNGLHGFDKGQRTIFLNSDNGSAIFGKAGGGRIIIDPTTNQALLYTDSFWKGTKENGLPDTDYSFDDTTKKYNNQSNKGMLIDLSAPRIIFGSGNFRIDEDGKVVAEGGVIAGVKIEGDIETVDKKTTEGNPYFTLDSVNGAIYSNSKRGLTDTNKGFYLSHDGFGIGVYNTTKGHNPFEVSVDGVLYCKSGQIGPAIFTENIFKIGKMEMGGGYIANDDGKWGIGTTGMAFFAKVTADYGTLGNWSFDKATNMPGLYSGGNYIYTTGDFKIGDSDIWIKTDVASETVEVMSTNWEKIIFKNSTLGTQITLQDIIDATEIEPKEIE